MTNNSETWEVTITAVDMRNPSIGHKLLVTKDGKQVYASTVNPLTGDPMDYYACLEIAVLYGPPLDARAAGRLQTAHRAKTPT